MTDNPSFPAPVPALWVVSAAVTALQNAEAVARTRVAGAVVTRDEKRTTLVALLNQLCSYVQVTADGDMENARAIIESAGMTVQQGTPPARVFSAKLGSVSGEVLLVAPRAADRAAYEWAYSTDGGASWLEMPPTLQSSTRLVGLTPGTSVMFRYRCVTRSGVGGWSQPITLAQVK